MFVYSESNFSAQKRSDKKYCGMEIFLRENLAIVDDFLMHYG